MYSKVDPKSARIVQKYGGTSVGSPERIQGIAQRAAAHKAAGFRNIAIVVSAMSGETNRLLGLVKAVNPDADPKFADFAAAAGEQVSVAMTCAALQKAGLKAIPFLAYQLGIVTDSFHAQARVRTISAHRIEEAWLRGEVPVVAGYQGITEDMELTTLGRGGSDTSAVALAVALKADFCEINTDVDGVFTADPRVVPKARLIQEMDYEVALEMASLGSKVLHPRCVELGAKYQLPIIVRNTFTADTHQRTCVMTQSKEQLIESPVVSGVTLEKDIAKITLTLPKGDSAAISKVFSHIATLGVNVDIIVHDRLPDALRVGFSIAGADLARTKASLASFASAGGMTVMGENGYAKVSAVGVGMRSYSGVAAKLFDSLTRGGVDIHMISTSEIKISCLVSAADGEKSCQLIHHAFIESTPA